MRIGAGASQELAAVLQQLGLARPLLVTDAYLLKTGRVEALMAPLAEAGIEARIFADTVPRSHDRLGACGTRLSRRRNA